MTTFENNIIIDRPLSDVYQFLADFNNHQQLMPDNIQDWTSTNDEATFGIQNMAQLSLKIAERIENQSINIIATGKPPFDVQLKWNMVAEGNSTSVIFTILAELNMMMKMLASAPLQKLANHETTALAAVLK